MSDIIWWGQFEHGMLSRGYPDSASRLDVSTDFHFHFDSTFEYFLDNTNSLSVIEVDNIVWFQVVLDEVAINS